MVKIVMAENIVLLRNFFLDHPVRTGVPWVHNVPIQFNGFKIDFYKRDLTRNQGTGGGGGKAQNICNLNPGLSDIKG